MTAKLTKADYARRGWLVTQGFERELTPDEKAEREQLEAAMDAEQMERMAPALRAMEERVERLRKLAADIAALRKELKR